MTHRVLGADVAAGQWVGVVLGDGAPEAVTAPTVGELVRLAMAGGSLDVVGLDIPIGLPGAGRRAADVLARGLVGRRSSSVFMTPVRAAVEAEDFAAALETNRRLAGEGLSQQTFGLRHKVLEVDAWVRRTWQVVVEVHPEVSFAALAGEPLPHRKKSWAGAEHRRALLAGAGIALPPDLGRAGEVAAVDDVLDAAVVAWTARRRAEGTARCHPDPPERTPDGWPAAIWA